MLQLEIEGIKTLLNTSHSVPVGISHQREPESQYHVLHLQVSQCFLLLWRSVLFENINSLRDTAFSLWFTTKQSSDLQQSVTWWLFTNVSVEPTASISP
jgi:hypothetical protein